MKYIKFIVLGFTIFLFVGCDFLSCPANSNKPDSYYFNKMEPLEWSDDYIVAATNYPNQIQVWDSKSNRMIHKYSLFTDETKWEQGTERALRVYSMAVYEGVIWFIGIGMQTSLIRLDCKTGEMKYINLDITPWEVVVVPEENGGKYIRFLYKVNSLENFSIEYTGIKYDEDDARTFFNVHNDDENIFVTGRSLYKTTKKDLRGLETGLYPKNGGEQIKRVPMPEGNQVYCDRREYCAYFSKDVYTQDDVTYEWDKTKKPAIYKLDYKTQTVYEYDADGNETVLDWIED